ncbi:MAG TPA: anti-sigma factor [Pseudolabrys sp.]|nr:anti-sigma factor [Pseudolabrys sp.]
MRCDEASERIGLLIDGELAGDERRALLEHVESCVTCRRYRDELKRLQQHLAQAHQPAPRALLHRVRGALASEAAPGTAVARRPQTLPTRMAAHMRGRLRPLIVQAAAVLVACIFTAGMTFWLTQESDTQALLAKDVMSAHMRSLLQDNAVQVASLDTHTVKPWFAGRLEYTPVVKDLSAEGFQLVGGRLDYVEGHRVAALVYRRRLHEISVFTWPESGGDTAPHRATVNGYNILSWTKGGMAYWAVSDLNDGELRQLQALL